jgi:hypothetical protein
VKLWHGVLTEIRCLADEFLCKGIIAGAVLDYSLDVISAVARTHLVQQNGVL